MKRLLSLMLFLSVLVGRAQVPDTDVWLFKLVPDKSGRPFPEKPVNISNRAGYDNQPCFAENGKGVYYVSMREDKQSDVYFYDIASGKQLQITKSKESEYSPMPMPGGKLLSVVMVEADSAQRIHFIDAKTGANASRLEFDSVGYYWFINPDTVAYYKLTEPHSLNYHSKLSNKSCWLGNMPTRTFRAINRYTLLYGLKDSTHVTYFKYNFLIGKALPYCQSPSPGEDIYWSKEMGLVRSEGTQLMRYNDTTQAWELLYDLGLYGVKKITRFVFDSKHKYLAVVNNL